MKKLYKYRAFDVNTLNMLRNSEVYYANPTLFNDPLDCKPTLTVDVTFTELQQLCFRMFEIEYSAERATKELERCLYYSTEPENISREDREGYHCKLLVNEVEKLIHLKMKKRGVLSLAGSWQSCLMWSHYADEHNGICLEYDMTEAITFDSKSVEYNSDRNLLVSDVISWIFNHTPFSHAIVESKYFFTKAQPWEYEQETRFLANHQGVDSAPFHLSAVYFGLRCEPTVISCIVKLMDGANRDIDFYQIYTTANSFELMERELDKDEILNSSPRESAKMVFSPFVTP
jgi:hypothetical protein